MKTEITSPLTWFEDTMESSETAGTLIVLLWIWVPAEPANSVENKSSLRRRKYNIKQIESGFPDSGKLKARFVTQGGLQTSSLASNLNAQKADRLYPWIANKIGENQHLFSKTVLFTSNFRGALMFGPLDSLNLWKSVNRIRIIMGKSGCTQIRTSSSCSSENFFCNQFFCVPNILPRGLIGHLTKFDNYFWQFFVTPITFLANFWSYSWELSQKGSFFSNLGSFLLEWIFLNKQFYIPLPDPLTEKKNCELKRCLIYLSVFCQSTVNLLEGKI